MQAAVLAAATTAHRFCNIHRPKRLTNKYVVESIACPQERRLYMQLLQVTMLSSTSKTYLRVARSSPAESERCPGSSSGGSHGSRDRSRTLPRLLLYTRQHATRLARWTMDISPQCRKQARIKFYLQFPTARATGTVPPSRWLLEEGAKKRSGKDAVSASHITSKVRR